MRKRRVVRRIWWNEIQLTGPQRQKQTQEQSKNEWARSVRLCQRHEPQHPHHVKVSPWGLLIKRWFFLSVYCDVLYLTKQIHFIVVITLCTPLSKRWFFLSVHFDTNLFHKTDSFLLLLSLSHHVQSFCLQNDYFTKQINFCCHFAFYTGEQKGIFAIALCCTTSENWPTV